MSSNFGENNRESPDGVCKYNHLLQKLWERYRGIIYTLISTCVYSLSSIFTKLLDYNHPVTIGFYGYLIAFALSTLCNIYLIKIKKECIFQNILPLSKNKKVLFLMSARAVGNAVLVYGLILSIRYITVADSRTIISSAVITVYLFGRIFLHEKCGLVPLLVAVVALCGIVIVARPPFLTGLETFDVNTLVSGFAI